MSVLALGLLMSFFMAIAGDRHLLAACCGAGALATALLAFILAVT